MTPEMFALFCALAAAWWYWPSAGGSIPTDEKFMPERDDQPRPVPRTPSAEDADLAVETIHARLIGTGDSEANATAILRDLKACLSGRK